MKLRPRARACAIAAGPILLLEAAIPEARPTGGKKKAPPLNVEADADGDFWIIAGGSSGDPVASRIVHWDGSGPAVRPAATLPGHLKAEGVARMVVGDKPVTVVLCDTSQYLLLR